MENIPPLLEIEERQQIQQRLSMKGATEPLFAKATYNERREGLGSPQWHFTMYPSVLLTEFFSEKIYFWKKSNLILHNIKKNLNKTDLYLQNMKKQPTTLG